MKKAILSTILLLSSTSLLADTTMCFKENHKSMSTIENTPLDGGVCNSKFSVNDMKAKGWNVDDIKISTTTTGMNFIYILKTATSSAPTTSSNFVGNQAQMEANIIAKLEKKKQDEIKQKEVEEIKKAAVDGENTYKDKCQACHGVNGEKRAYNSSRPLKDLSVEDMIQAMKDYKNGRIDSPNAILMTPYANYSNEDIVKGVYGYLNKINNK